MQKLTKIENKLIIPSKYWQNNSIDSRRLKDYIMPVPCLRTSKNKAKLLDKSIVLESKEKTDTEIVKSQDSNVEISHENSIHLPSIWLKENKQKSIHFIDKKKISKKQKKGNNPSSLYTSWNIHI